MRSPRRERVRAALSLPFQILKKRLDGLLQSACQLTDSPFFNLTHSHLQSLSVKNQRGAEAHGDRAGNFLTPILAWVMESRVGEGVQVE